ncbi:pentapeptide repeat-containing protein [Chitinimonas lacunae]|uniref:Pentapeptide repeat-containing protein n=1 Tax=Chitinimonas lacunae TaxID=1963018 RepID=A0ABV8MSW4_9NEIS
MNVAELDELPMYFCCENLDDRDWRGAVLRGAVFEGVSMCDTRLAHADLSGAEFYLCMGAGEVFRNATLCDARFLGGRFEGVSFAGADLRNAAFCKDELDNYVILCGADFTDALLDGAVFDGAVYNAATRFPPGFEPELRGFVRMSLL